MPSDHSSDSSRSAKVSKRGTRSSKEEDDRQRGKNVDWAERRRALFRGQETDEEYASSFDIKKVLFGLKRHFLLYFCVIALFAIAGWGVAQYLSTRFVAESFLVYNEELDNYNRILKTQNRTILLKYTNLFK